MVVLDAVAAPVRFVRGDSNGDSAVDISDAVATLNYLFVGEGQVLACEDAGDVNDDGALNITDPVYVLSYLFQGGLPPREPFPGEGVDETEDQLSCAAAN